MNSLQEVIVQELDKLSQTDLEFYKHMRTVFGIGLLCDILGINRNRYNYLYKVGKLYTEIVKLRKEVRK